MGTMLLTKILIDNFARIIFISEKQERVWPQATLMNFWRLWLEMIRKKKKAIRKFDANFNISIGNILYHFRAISKKKESLINGLHLNLMRNKISDKWKLALNMFSNINWFVFCILWLFVMTNEFAYLPSHWIWVTSSSINRN